MKNRSRTHAAVAAAVTVGTLGIAAVAGAASPVGGPARASVAVHGAKSPSAQAITPLFIAGTFHGRRPRDIDLSADATNIVTELHWQHWGTVTALGAGTSNLQGCVPNCAAGSETPVRTTIEFLDPSHGYFTKLIERRDGHTMTYHYTPGHNPDDWPGEAS